MAARPSSTIGPCAISKQCGGCALIDLAYSEQLRSKAARVRDAIGRHAELDGIEVAACLPAPEVVDYRNRAKLAVEHADGHVRIGLYRRGSNRIVDLESCVVSRPALRRGIARVREWLEQHRLARPFGPVFYVDLRASAGDRCHLTVVVGERDFAALELPLDSLCEAWPELVGIAANEGDPTSSFPFGPRTKILRGEPSFVALVPSDEGTVAFDVPVGGFFQVATSLLPDVHALMRAHVEGSGPLYDLYCGVGVHGLLLARKSPDALVGIEESPSAAAAAERNAQRLGVAACFRAGKVETLLAATLAERPARRFVLNPARAGCSPRVLDTLLTVDAPRIAYLSCDPTTLARDLAVLVRGGLAVRAIVPLDLMPQTDHVETLALIA